MPTITAPVSPPGPTKLHLVADYVEFRSLTSLENQYSAEELRAERDRQADLGRRGDTSLSSTLRQSRDPGGEDLAELVGVRPPDPGEDSLGGIDVEGAASTEQSRATRRRWAPGSDTSVQAAHDLAQHIEMRKTVFGDGYPFETDAGPVLRLKEELSDTQRVYLGLLICATLEHFKHLTHRAKLTKQFERMSADALREYLGDAAQVHVFGTGTQKGDRYSGNAWTRLRRLSSDLALPLGVTRDQIPTSGDRGLDLIGWFPLAEGEAEHGRLILAAQCGAGLDWPEKQSSSGPARWRNILKMTVPWSNAMFIPYCFRSPDGSWWDSTVLEESILFDRQRLTTLLDDRIEEVPSELLDRVLQEALGPAD